MAERNGGNETVAMVLGGGVALGAYQAGAYAALHESGGPAPDWLAGSSIGAVNAAVIAGNAPERRVERLRAFWEAAAIGTVLHLMPSWIAGHGGWRHAHNWLSALQIRLLGRPGFFRPRLPGLAPEPAPSFYDFRPFRQRLEEFIDFGRLNGGAPRLTVVTTDIETGDAVVFDTGRGDRIAPEHLLATCGFLPDFPPIEIGGRLLGDGGLVANAPVHTVLRGEPADLLCFVLDLFARTGRRPRSLETASARQWDLILANQTHWNLEACRREYELRAELGRLAARLPPELRRDSDAALTEGATRAARVLFMSYHAPPDEAGAERMYDFSRRTLLDRWEAGALDMAEALRVLAAESAGERRPGLTIRAIRR
jgi:NTE family protein